jgi:hypothetical protein
MPNTPAQTFAQRYEANTPEEKEALFDEIATRLVFAENALARTEVGVFVSYRPSDGIISVTWPSSVSDIRIIRILEMARDQVMARMLKDAEERGRQDGSTKTPGDGLHPGGDGSGVTV